MKRDALLFMILTSIVLTTSVDYSTPCYADEYKVHDGDFVYFGYQLIVNSLTIETKTESDPVQVNFAPETLNPPGLYDALKGMKNGQIKSTVTIYPGEDGFSPSDPVYGAYAESILTYKNLQVYNINGFPYTDVYPEGVGSFGRTLLIVVGVILGIGGVVGISYVIYRFSPKIFGKRCLKCKTLAIGSCKNCGANFCEKCFSNGCTSCKGRSLIRFK